MKKYKGYILIFISAVLWGTLPIFSSLSYKLGSNGITSGAMRAYLAAVIFIIWLAADGSFKKLKREELPFYVFYGIVAGGGTFVCYMVAIEYLSVAMAAVLLYTAPAFVVIFDRLLYKVPLTWYKLAAVIGCFAGSFLVVKGYEIGTLDASAKGIAIGLCSGISYSMTSVLGKKAKTMHDGKTNSGLMVIFGTLPFFFLKSPFQITISSSELMLLYVGLAVVGTVIPYFLYLKGIDTGIDIGAASIIATVEPIVGTLLGVLVLGETLELAQIFGIVIMVAGIVLSVLEQGK